VNAIKEGDLSNANETAVAGNGLPDSDDVISRVLVNARKNAVPLDLFPGVVPDSMAQAYAIQAASIARWPDSVAGWKVGMLTPQDQGRYSAERLAGPIFASQVHTVSAGSSSVMPIFVGGFAALEAEFVFRLGQKIEPIERVWSEKDLAHSVAGLHVGAEIASSPMAEINNLGPTVVASDFGNNAGLLLGPEIANWQAMQPAELTAKVFVNGDIVGDASAAAIQGGPIAALKFILALSASRGIELPAGTLISTGACTGIHDVEVTSECCVDFGDHGLFDVAFEPMTGTQ
jgi:2-keto-4-pentenoate hydratase